VIVVTAEPAHRRVRARMGGMLTLAEVEAFSTREQAAVRSMGLKSGEFDLLVETEGNLVQTQEVMDALGKLMLHSPLKARRIATVRAGALTRMQSRRLSTLRSNTEVFDTCAAAELWLAEPE
jgi:hypothetical protein